MLTLPPAHTLGAALSQATAGALGSLLTIVAICAPLLLLWLGCRWLEQRLPTGWPLEHPADPLADGADGAEDVIHTTVPTLRSMRRQTLGSTPASLADATTDATMAPLRLSDLELAEVKTFPSLPVARPNARPNAQPSAFPLYQSPAMPSSQPEQPAQPEQPSQPWDNWPPRGKPGQYPYRYIFVGSVLVRVASLYPYIAGDVQHDIWN